MEIDDHIKSAFPQGSTDGGPHFAWIQNGYGLDCHFLYLRLEWLRLFYGGLRNGASPSLSLSV
jgi:hypothetical protein